MTLLKKLLPLAKAHNPIDPNLLGQIPYFDSVFKDKHLWTILTRLSGRGGIAHIELKKFKAGETIISKGKFDQMIYWIIKGSADVLSPIKGKAKIIHTAKRGECLGELGVLRGAPRNNDVIAGKTGATSIEVDWAITDKSPELNECFISLLSLHMADKLDKSYARHLKIINNAMNMIHKKTTSLIDKNRKLSRILKEHGLNVEKDTLSDEQALSHAIANIRESLDLLRLQEANNTFQELGSRLEI